MPELAEAVIRRHLTDCLPPGAPLSFRLILSAKFVGTGRKKKAVGRLEMFDGLPATVEVFKAGEALGIPMWGHRWTDMPSGSCSFEGDRWVRCDEDGNVLPDQIPLPLAAA